MTLADVIVAMRAVGCSAEQIIAVTEALDLRSVGAKRQARYRERKRNESVTERNALRKRDAHRDTTQVDFIQSVVAQWNDTAAYYRLPQVKDITVPRQAAIMARAKDLTETYDFPDPSAGFVVLFNHVKGSPFLRGEANGFRCDLDFCIRSSSFTKIMEGRYESQGNPTARTPYRGSRA
jgi:hypothetical protein